ncbi:DUF11 domain-containing protein [Eggerthellaceae bacterium zg-1084]|uniref:isopeptide-forming domain-containing fimbrial protein n=1 Tax=Berryella wangjianweii TaxID=2734634 RepID=UPI001553D266|nr:isopeptide-forming domain-containing fimbrial protein [Berryella wangjianweii]NPD31656.1 DUF11 domain-containing protein [Berryella wangjianweii]
MITIAHSRSTITKAPRGPSGSRTLRLLMALLVGLAMAALTAPAIAGADPIFETVDLEASQQANPLVISTGLQDDPGSLTNAGPVTQPARLISSAPPASRITEVHELWANGQIDFEGTTAEALRQKLHPYFGCDDYITQGRTFEFEDGAWEQGDPVEARFEYPCVGSYEGEAVGAVLSVKGRFSPIWPNLSYPVVQLPNLLYAGGYLFNMVDTSFTMEFFYCSDHSPVALQGAYLTYCSQNWIDTGVEDAYPNLQPGELYSESILLPVDRTERIGLSPDSNIRHRVIEVDGTSYVHCYPITNDFDDHLGKERYTLNATTFFQPDRFTFRTPFTGWFSFASASIGFPAPPAPQKRADCASAPPGHPITWSIDQRAGSLGSTVLSRYRSFTFADTLPAELSFKEARMLQVTSDGTTDITDEAGQLTWDESTRTLSYSFSGDWLDQSMPLHGETYRLEVGTVLTTEATTAERVRNEARVMVNHHEGTADAQVEVERPEPPAPPAPEPPAIPTADPPAHPETPIIPPTQGSLVTAYKSSEPLSGTPVVAGDLIRYQLTVRNTGAHLSGRTLVRDAVPAGTQLVADSIEGNGAFVSGEDGEPGYVEWAVGPLPPGVVAQLSFSVRVSEQPIGSLPVVNTARFEERPESFEPGDPRNPQPALTTNTTVHPTAPDTSVPANVTVVKGAQPAPGRPVSPGEIVHYTLLVTNNDAQGRPAARSIRVRDRLPDGCTLAKSQPKSNYPAAYDAEARTVCWTIDELSAQESAELSFDVVAPQPAAAPAPEVSAAPAGTDSDPADPGRGRQQAVLDNQAQFQVEWAPDSPELQNSTNIVRHPLAQPAPLNPEPARQPDLAPPPDSTVSAQNADSDQPQPYARTGNPLLDWWPMAAGLSAVGVGCAVAGGALLRHREAQRTQLPTIPRR